MPLLIGGIAVQGNGRNARIREVLCHESGMFHRHAEAKGFQLIHVGDVFVHLLQHMVSTLAGNRSGKGVQVGQFLAVIAATHPVQIIQVDGIRYTKVLEGAQQLSIDGFRQANLGSNALVKIVQNAFAVHAFRGGG